MRLLPLAFLGAQLFAQGLSKEQAVTAAPPLYAAIMADDLLAVRRLAHAGNVDAPIQPPKYPDTPLGLAAYLGRLKIVRFLVEDLKADIELPSRTISSEQSPAELAVTNIGQPGQEAVAAYLLPRYPFYKDYLALVKSAGPYAAASFAWPEGVKVLFVGERHGIADFPPEVAKLVEALPVTHYATEFLLQSDQETIDAYEADEIDEAEFIRRTQRPQTAEVAAAAKKKTVKIVGLEKPVTSGRKGDAVGRDLLAERNRNWLVPIMDILDNFPDARLLVYCGFAHSNRRAPGSASAQLAAKIGSEQVHVVELAGGTHAHGGDYYDLPTYMADKAGRAGDDFKAEAKGASEAARAAMGGDAILHLKHASILNP